MAELEKNQSDFFKFGSGAPGSIKVIELFFFSFIKLALLFLSKLDQYLKFRCCTECVFALFNFWSDARDSARLKQGKPFSCKATWLPVFFFFFILHKRRKTKAVDKMFWLTEMPEMSSEKRVHERVEKEEIYFRTSLWVHLKILRKVYI